MFLKLLFVIFTIIVLQSCGQDNHIRTYYLSKEKENNFIPPAIIRETAPSGFIWEKPDSWVPSEGSSMRIASFAIPYSGGSGDLSIIQLSGTGGGIESNVNRWRRQLDLEPLNWIAIEKNVINKKGKLGMYSVLKIINNKIDSAFLCAIIPIVTNTIFVKLSLRPIGITEVEDDFMIFCSSLTTTN